MSKIKKEAKVLSQENIASGIFSMWLEIPRIAGQAVPGQFISVYSADRSRLLPRPISICEIDREAGSLRIVYRIAGKGTEEFSRLAPGDTLEILGPLGNGYELDPVKAAGLPEGTDQSGISALLLAGGIGIPPMLQLAKELKCRTIAVLGYRSELFLNKEFEKYAEVYISTEDGSCGTHGNVLDVVRENGLAADVIYSCGPAPMLRAISGYAREKNIEAWVSLEEKMACGIGACLACVCESTEVDEHSKVYNKRVCKDGPVFNSREVKI